MKILVVGSGGREHALCWKISQSEHCDELFCAPGNGGLGRIAQTVPGPAAISIVPKTLTGAEASTVMVLNTDEATELCKDSCAPPGMHAHGVDGTRGRDDGVIPQEIPGCRSVVP